MGSVKDTETTMCKCLALRRAWYCSGSLRSHLCLVRTGEQGQEPGPRWISAVFRGARSRGRLGAEEGDDLTQVLGSALWLRRGEETVPDGGGCLWRAAVGVAVMLGPWNSYFGRTNWTF